jgi:hypothetical protein
MRIRRLSNGYALWLSANDTELWANRPGNFWPCSVLSGNRLFVGVDSHGIVEYAVNGNEVPDCGHELEAIISDHLPDDCKQYWPCWK